MRRIMIAGVVAILAAGGALWLRSADREIPAAPVAAADPEAWRRLDADEAAPGFALIAQDGRRISLAELRGRVLVLTFFFSECASICPTQLNRIDAVFRELSTEDRQRVTLAAITIDPARDTPAKLAQVETARGLTKGAWLLLTGSAGEIAAVVDAYGVNAQAAPMGDLLHNTVYILIDGRGRLRVEFHGIFTPGGELLTALRALLAEPQVNHGG